MVTQTSTQPVKWQDLKVLSEVDIVLEMARQKGWKDCEIFGRGDMITQPQESMGWKLIPADLYEYSIPAEGVDRVIQTMNAGVRIQGVIIADDERSAKPAPTPPPAPPPAPKAAEPVDALTADTVFTWIAGALMGLFFIPIAIICAPLWILGSIFGTGIGSGTEYDPKLVILVEDEKGDTVWVSLLTWYD